MATSYPGALDTFTNPLATDTLDASSVAHAAQHDHINDAVKAIQIALGTSPQGGYSNVAARLNAAAYSGHTHAIADVSGLQTALNAKAASSITISAGSGLTGGGDLTANRALAVSWGGTGAATTAARSDHNHDGVYTKYVIQTLGSALPDPTAYPAGTIVAQY